MTALDGTCGPYSLFSNMAIFIEHKQQRQSSPTERFSPNLSCVKRICSKAGLMGAVPDLKRKVLSPGLNVWRLATADTTAVLIDAAAYFSCLRAAFLQAQHTIYIAGWDIDTRTPLWSAEPEKLPGDASARDNLPVELGAFLVELVKQRPELTIKILLWDYSFIYAPDRELAPELRFLWTTPPQIDLCLDNEIPVGSSHHQKLVVIDNKLAFCGGMDLTIKRWDTPAHEAEHACRLDPRGIAYPPRHDVQMAVTGSVAVELAELFRLRWQRAAREALPINTATSAIDIDLTSFSPFCFQAASIGISRTIPADEEQSAIQEIRQLYLDQVARAERFIYLESQYVTFDDFAQALALRLRTRPALEVLIVCPLTYGSWVENNAMCVGRQRFLSILSTAGVAERVHLVYPVSQDGSKSTLILVHSKLIIIDDDQLRIGSANLCNRSMGADTECDLTLSADGNPTHQKMIETVRHTLIGEHLGIDAKAVRNHFQKGRSLRALLTEFRSGRRRLLPIPQDIDTVEWSLASGIADPAQPINPSLLVLPEKLRPGETKPEVQTTENDMKIRDKAKLRTLILLGLGFAVLAACWSFTPLSHLTRPDLWRGWLDYIRGPWELVVIVAIYVIAGFFAFPIVILIAVTAAIFGAWPGSIYAFTGAMASAMATYSVGRWVGRESLRRFLGPRLNRASESLLKSGIVTTTIARLIPAAPYTLVNLAAGALKVNLGHYLIGTALGLAPGIIVMAVLGRHIIWSIQHPTSGNIAIVIAMICGAVLLALGLQRLMKLIKRHRQ